MPRLPPRRVAPRSSAVVAAAACAVLATHRYARALPRRADVRSVSLRSLRFTARRLRSAWRRRRRAPLALAAVPAALSLAALSLVAAAPRSARGALARRSRAAGLPAAARASLPPCAARLAGDGSPAPVCARRSPRLLFRRPCALCSPWLRAASVAAKRSRVARLGFASRFGGLRRRSLLPRGRCRRVAPPVGAFRAGLGRVAAPARGGF